MENIQSAQYVADEFGANQTIRANFSGEIVSVPLVAGNRHYDAIQKWVAEGNTITPADS